MFPSFNKARRRHPPCRIPGGSRAKYCVGPTLLRFCGPSRRPTPPPLMMQGWLLSRGGVGERHIRLGQRWRHDCRKDAGVAAPGRCCGVVGPGWLPRDSGNGSFAAATMLPHKRCVSMGCGLAAVRSVSVPSYVGMCRLHCSGRKTGRAASGCRRPPSARSHLVLLRLHEVIHLLRPFPSPALSIDRSAPVVAPTPRLAVPSQCLCSPDDRFF
jgi:hypothetical protein